MKTESTSNPLKKNPLSPDWDLINRELFLETPTSPPNVVAGPGDEEEEEDDYPEDWEELDEDGEDEDEGLIAEYPFLDEPGDFDEEYDEED